MIEQRKFTNMRGYKARKCPKTSQRLDFHGRDNGLLYSRFSMTESEREKESSSRQILRQRVQRNQS